MAENISIAAVGVADSLSFLIYRWLRLAQEICLALLGLQALGPQALGPQAPGMNAPISNNDRGMTEQPVDQLYLFRQANGL
jgi:hypothetical protein